MTPELQILLDARIIELENILLPQQYNYKNEHGKFEYIPWTLDTGWTGQGILEYSVTEYVGPSELPEDNNAEKIGGNGLARFTDADGVVYVKSKDYGCQPSRNQDWIKQETTNIWMT